MCTKMSTQSVINFGAICRICLKEDGPMSSVLTSVPGKECQSIATRITSIAGVQVDTMDGLPGSICEPCRQQVDKCYDFRLLIELSDRTLRSQLSRQQGNVKKNTLQTVDTASDLDYYEYLAAGSSQDKPKEFYAVNALILSSQNVTQLWQVCNEEDLTIRRHLPETNDAKSTRQEEKTAGNANTTNGSEEVSHPLGTIKIITRAEGKGEEASNETKKTHFDQEENLSDISQDPMIYTVILDDENPLAIENVNNSAYLTSKYRCQLCTKPFETLTRLKNHVKDHVEAGKTTPQVSTLQKGDSRPTTESPNAPEKKKSSGGKFEGFEVSTVSESCTRESEGELNSAIRTFTEIRKKNVHCCTECGLEFSKSSELRYHRTTHTNLSLICPTCQKNFSNPQSLKMHLKRHGPDSRFHCHLCTKQYFSKSELARHAQTHTGLREHKCQMCEMSFMSKPELNRHHKYHNGVKRFQCSVCTKSYYESGHLKIHERVHTGERPFACKTCAKAFATKSKLVRHCKIHDR